MKKLHQRILMGVILISVICISCNQEIQNSIPQLFVENPTTINWDTSKTDTIETFSATVLVYEDNNRRTGGAKLQSQYKMSVKLVADRQYIRLDFPATEHIAAKTVLSNGLDTILVDTATNSIEQKIIASEIESKLFNELGYITSQQTLSKINLSRIRSEASKLSLDVNENKEEGFFTIELPSNYFSSDRENRISTKISYDTVNELMTTIETVTKKEDGSIVTAVTCPVYEETETGHLIKIGQYSIIDTKYEILYENLEELEYFHSLDTIPEISNSEYEQLVSAGNAVTIEEFPLGNPADLSSVETIIELYENVEVNVVDDSLFKLIMEI